MVGHVMDRPGDTDFGHGPAEVVIPAGLQLGHADLFAGIVVDETGMAAGVAELGEGFDGPVDDHRVEAENIPLRGHDKAGVGEAEKYAGITTDICQNATKNEKIFS